MRLAVLADIHGNRRALDAVLEDVARRGVDRIVNLGDSLYGPFDPRPVADRLVAEGWLTVSGNEDRCLVEAADEQAVSKTARFTFDQLEGCHIDWLRNLPTTLALDGGVYAFHASPESDTRYLLHEPMPDGSMRPRTPKEIAADLRGIDAPLILCAHDHLPRVVELPDGWTVVNPGSVGCPAYTDVHPVSHRVETGTPHARYAIIHLARNGVVGVTPFEVAYDWDAAATEAVANGCTDWARWLRTGAAR